MRITTALALLATGALASAGPIVYVPGSSNIWLAGMPDGTLGGAGDSAPAQSPVLVTGLTLAPGNSLNFTVWGLAAHGPNKPLWNADGGTLSSHSFGALFGMSDLGGPLASLVGVFLTDTQPDLNSAPPTLTWAGQSFGEYATLSPLLQQPFFIGDGLTGGGQQQWVFIPTGATRLYLGTLDGLRWSDNIGGFEVQVSESPEPSTAALLGTALAAVGLIRRRARRA
jgi:hypothetical protein